MPAAKKIWRTHPLRPTSLHRESVWAALRHKRWLGCQLSHFWHETPVFSLSHTLMLPKQISLQLRGSHEKKHLWKVIHVKQAFSRQSEHQHHRKHKSCSLVRLVSGCTLRQTSPKSQIDYHGCWVLPCLLDSLLHIEIPTREQKITVMSL